MAGDADDLERHKGDANTKLGQPKKGKADLEGASRKILRSI